MISAERRSDAAGGGWGTGRSLKELEEDAGIGSQSTAGERCTEFYAHDAAFREHFTEATNSKILSAWGMLREKRNGFKLERLPDLMEEKRPGDKRNCGDDWDDDAARIEKKDAIAQDLDSEDGDDDRIFDLDDIELVGRVKSGENLKPMVRKALVQFARDAVKVVTDPKATARAPAKSKKQQRKRKMSGGDKAPKQQKDPICLPDAMRILAMTNEELESLKWTDKTLSRVMDHVRCQNPHPRVTMACQAVRNAKELDDKNGNPKKTRTGAHRREVLERTESMNDAELRAYVKPLSSETYQEQYDHLRGAVRTSQKKDQVAEEEEGEECKRCKDAMKRLHNARYSGSDVERQAWSSTGAPMEVDPKPKRYRKPKGSPKIELAKVVAAVTSTNPDVLREELRTMDKTTYRRTYLALYQGARKKNKRHSEVRQAAFNKFKSCSPTAVPKSTPLPAN